MAIDSCDHGEYIVAYSTHASISCPVCELENDIKDLKAQVEELENKD